MTHNNNNNNDNNNNNNNDNNVVMSRFIMDDFLIVHMDCRVFNLHVLIYECSYFPSYVCMSVSISL